MLSPGGGCGIVRHHEDGGRLRGRSCGHDARHSTGAFGELGEPVENGRGGGDVEGGRGLISEDDVGAGGQNAGDGHTLTLTTAHLMRQVAGLLAQTHALEGIVDGAAAQGFTTQAAGQSHVVARGQGGDEVVVLEDEADVPSPEAGSGPGT